MNLKYLRAYIIHFDNLRFGDSQKNMRKSERKIKELTFAADEDKKNHER